MNNIELDDLRKKILLFNEMYEKGQPLVTDIVYDFYKKKLAILEAKENMKISEYVGTKTLNQPLPHLFPILSLEHEFGADSIEKFIQRMNKTLNPFPLIAELKIDGVSLIAKYIHGKIQYLKTRGNGILGEDISYLIPYLPIPNQIYLKEELEIRFEGYFDKTIKNARNAAAGILFKKNIDTIKLAHLKLTPHNLYSKHQIWNSYNELREIFFKMHLIPIFPFAQCNSIEECKEFFDRIDQEKKSLPFEIDGIVFKVNSFKSQEILGNSSKAPKFAFAIKFENSFNISEILNIEFKVGRTGKIIPVAKIQEVTIKNRKISNATLNNLNFLKSKQFAIKDIVKLEMAGEVIPKITEIIEKSNNTTTIPTRCPCCQSNLVENSCLESWECEEQRINKIIYFASKPCMNIKNLGEAQIETFVKEKIIKYPHDLYSLKNNIKKLTYTPTWLGTKFLENLIKAIENSAYVTIETFLISCGLPYLAKQTVLKVIQQFTNIENFLNSSEEELSFLGPKKALELYTAKEKEKFWIEKTLPFLKINQSPSNYSLFDFS